jgi:hypothetical protein
MTEIKTTHLEVNHVASLDLVEVVLQQHLHAAEAIHDR